MKRRQANAEFCEAKNLTYEGRCLEDACRVESTGNSGWRTVVMTPLRPGRVQLEVVARDLELRRFVSDEFTVVTVERVELTCLVQEPKGKTRPCTAGPIAPNQQVFLIPSVEGPPGLPKPHVRVKTDPGDRSVPFECRTAPDPRSVQDVVFQCTASLSEGSYFAEAELGAQRQRVDITVSSAR